MMRKINSVAIIFPNTLYGQARGLRSLPKTRRWNLSRLVNVTLATLVFDICLDSWHEPIYIVPENSPGIQTEPSSVTRTGRFIRIDHHFHGEKRYRLFCQFLRDSFSSSGGHWNPTFPTENPWVSSKAHN